MTRRMTSQLRAELGSLRRRRDERTATDTLLLLADTMITILESVSAMLGLMEPAGLTAEIIAGALDELEREIGEER